MTIIYLALVAVVFAAIVGFMVSRMYHRTTPEIALVRTGSGGTKVVTGGGVMVVPVIHQLSKVNLQTLGLEIRRQADEALITKDRMRANIGVKFFVRVDSKDDSIQEAAKTLGQKTFQTDTLTKFVEDKLVDALRSVAATLDMDELHENRTDFISKVKTAVEDDLKRNGLMLESVSLTSFDQTPFNEIENQDNVFDAVGSRNAAEVIDQSKRERAKINAATKVEVEETNAAADIRTSEINRDRRKQQIENETSVAEYEADAKKRRAALDAEADAAERTSIINANREVELAEADRVIAIQDKSKMESQSREEADKARARAVRAAEQVETAKEEEAANRRKSVAIIQASEEAEVSATKIRVDAAAEKDAAIDRAEALRTAFRARAEEIETLSEADKKRALDKAEGTKAQNEADNSVSAEIIRYRLESQRIESMPNILREMLNPIAHIDGIKVNIVHGLGASGGHVVKDADGNVIGSAQSQDIVGKVLETAAGALISMPVMKSVGQSIGMDLSDASSENIVNQVYNRLMGLDSQRIDDHRQQSETANDYRSDEAI